MYTIFKNLTIILIAYGEVLWFGGSVTPLTLVSFSLMVRWKERSGDPDLLADSQTLVGPVVPHGGEYGSPQLAQRNRGPGQAGRAIKRRICVDDGILSHCGLLRGIDQKLTPPLIAGQLLRIGGICPRHAQAHQGHQLQGLGLDVLQQPAVDPRPRVLFGPLRRLVERKPCSQLVSGIANTRRGRRIELTN